ncbi:MAG: hypothetical protein HON90_11195 [Halobacteriovoraceae bacterium]|jgi:hypothetical protein|nr:hypothetical protein [Halobacteriovoraceae bacterium]
MKVVFVFLLTTLVSNVFGKYDCAYLKKYCVYNEYPEDVWGDFYCGDFKIRHEVEFGGSKFVFKKNGDVLINKNKVGELPRHNSEFLLHSKGDILLLESNMHEEVGSFGTISIVDLKKNKLIEIGKTSPLYNHKLEILKDQITYKNDGYCWDYNTKTRKTTKPSKGECIMKLKDKVLVAKHKIVKAIYVGKKDEFGKYIPKSIRKKDLACNELITGTLIKWKKKEKKN